jgi:adenine-specific DNA-methyltransferase
MCFRLRRSAWPALAATALALLLAAPAGAMSLVPPKPDVLLGVSDRGSTEEFNSFAELTGKHPALMETFLGWGNSVNKAFERWRETQTRPVVAISTQNAQTLAEIITPEQIALGAGDDYLLQLNSFFASHGLPAYIRPLGEPNRCLNAWSGVECDGTLKGGEHSAYWYKEAFRRIAAIVRGGQTLEGLNATLAEIGLPPLARTKGENPESLPAAPVSIIWSPLPAGSPRVKGNFPGNYWPGSRWVDWVGTDFYSKYPVWEDHRVGAAGRRRTALRQAADRLGRHPQARPDVQLLPGLRGREHLRTRPLPPHREHPPQEAPPRQLPLLRRIRRRPPPPTPAKGKEGHEGIAGAVGRLGGVPIEFLGSKRKLLPFLTEKIGSHLREEGHFVDLFCGTASVASAFRANGSRVTANDQLEVCSTIAEASLLNRGTPGFRRLVEAGELFGQDDGDGHERVLARLNALPPSAGFIQRTYSPASFHECGVARMYLTEENAGKIDSIRRQIEDWEPLLTKGEKALLIVDLIAATSRRSNTAGTYGCYLKKWKPRSLEPLVLVRGPEPSQRGSDHAVHRQEAEHLLPSLEADVVYADPPYTKRQYAAYYHLLETIVRYDSPEVTGKTGLRPWSEASSSFCYRRKAPGALERLVGRLRAGHLFLSYNSDGQITDEEIREILSAHGRLDVWEIPYQRYKSSARPHRGPLVTERLYHLTSA